MGLCAEEEIVSYSELGAITVASMQDIVHHGTEYGLLWYTSASTVINLRATIASAFVQSAKLL